MAKQSLGMLKMKQKQPSQLNVKELWTMIEHSVVYFTREYRNWAGESEQMRVSRYYITLKERSKRNVRTNYDAVDTCELVIKWLLKHWKDFCSQMFCPYSCIENTQTSFPLAIFQSICFLTFQLKFWIEAQIVFSL